MGDKDDQDQVPGPLADRPANDFDAAINPPTSWVTPTAGVDYSYIATPEYSWMRDSGSDAIYTEFNGDSRIPTWFSKPSVDTVKVATGDLRSVAGQLEGELAATQAYYNAHDAPAPATLNGDKAPSPAAPLGENSLLRQDIMMGLAAPSVGGANFVEAIFLGMNMLRLGREAATLYAEAEMGQAGLADVLYGLADDYGTVDAINAEHLNLLLDPPLTPGPAAPPPGAAPDPGLGLDFSMPTDQEIAEMAARDPKDGSDMPHHIGSMLLPQNPLDEVSYGEALQPIVEAAMPDKK